jgi:hypothetical protein
LKVGDKLYCHTDYIGGVYDVDFISLYSGEYYHIHSIDKNSVYIIDRFGTVRHFSLVKTDYESVYSYFYTINELRKQKLQKLEEFDKYE